MSTNLGVPAPLYARALRLRHLRPGGLVCFLLFETMIAIAVLLALAELVNWWAVPILPVAVAVMVKINDLLVGLNAQASGQDGAAVPLSYQRRSSDRHGALDTAVERVPVATAFAPPRIGRQGNDRARGRASGVGTRTNAARGVTRISTNRISATRIAQTRTGQPGQARIRAGGPADAGTGRAARGHVGTGSGGTGNVGTGNAGTGQPAARPGQGGHPRAARSSAGSGMVPAPVPVSTGSTPDRQAVGTTYRSQSYNDAIARRRARIAAREPRQAIGVIRLSLPPRDGGVRAKAGSASGGAVVD